MPCYDTGLLAVFELVPCGNRYLYPVWVMVCGGMSYTSLSGVDVELCFVEVVWCDLPHNVLHPPSGKLPYMVFMCDGLARCSRSCYLVYVVSDILWFGYKGPAFG